VEVRPDDLRLLGVSFVTAPLTVREALSYSHEDAVELLQSVSIDGLAEAAVVSTCNRTEFYLFARDGCDVETKWLRHVSSRRPQARIGHESCRVVQTRGVDAARHLFRVASGLDSAILGDAHIGRQLKHALAVAAQAGTLGPVVSHSFRQAFAVGRDARARTEIGRGHASIGSAVAGLVRDRGSLDPQVLLVGAGAAARDIARQLTKWRAGALTVVNRTAERAAQMAQPIGARVAAWENLDAELAAADVIVAATSAPGPILTRDRLTAAVSARRGRTLLLIDTGVPRNIEPPDGVSYVTIDEIAARRDKAIDRRRQAVPAAEAIVETAVREWQRWCWAQPAEQLLRQVFAEEVARRAMLVEQIASAGFPGPPAEVDRLLRQTWRPVLKSHARALRTWLRDSSWSPGRSPSAINCCAPTPTARPASGHPACGTRPSDDCARCEDSARAGGRLRARVCPPPGDG
jgi:glutamyl-tRNA reductase